VCYVTSTRFHISTGLKHKETARTTTQTVERMDVPQTANDVLQHGVRLMERSMYFAASCVLRMLHNSLPAEEKHKTACLLAQCGIAMRSSELMSYAKESRVERLVQQVGLVQDTAMHKSMQTSLHAARDAPRPEWLSTQSETRTIITCAGGKDLLTQLWANLHSLKNVGCRLPVEVFHADEVCSTHREAFVAAFANHFCIRFVNLAESALCAPPYNMHVSDLRGFQIKLAAMCMTSGRSVLMMDADILWLSNPESLFDRCEDSYDAMVFSDIWHFQNKRHERTSTTTMLYETHALDTNIQEWESGVVYMNRESQWRAVAVLYHMCLNYQHYFRFTFGDKDLYHIALSVCGGRCHPRLPVPCILGVMRPSPTGEGEEFLSHSMLQRTDSGPSHVHMTLHPISDPESKSIPSHMCEADAIRFVTRSINGKNVGTIACDVCDAVATAAASHVYTAAIAALRDLPCLD
jgi:hypothetical protein